MSKDRWIREEPGWYWHPKLGNIIHDADGKWAWWPLRAYVPIYRARILKLAKEYAKQNF